MADNTNVLVFDGAGDFSVWSAQMESMLMQRYLLGYVKVRNYDGSQAFEYKGKLVPARRKTGLRALEVLKEEADATFLVQQSLHPSIQATIIAKNVFDSWESLRTRYQARRTLESVDTYTLHRAVNHMWLGDKKHEPTQEFIARWQGAVEKLSIAIGVEPTDASFSVQLVQTLPRAWRSDVDSWRGSQACVPFDQLVKHVVKKGNAEGIGTAKPPANDGKPTKRSSEKVCYYCFRSNHTHEHCRYLRRHIEHGNTHDPTSSYSCLKTKRRTQQMVDELEKFIAAEVIRSAARRSPSHAGRSPSCARCIRSRGDRSLSRSRRSHSQARSKSVVRQDGRSSHSERLFAPAMAAASPTPSFVRELRYEP